MTIRAAFKGAACSADQKNNRPKKFTGKKKFLGKKSTKFLKNFSKFYQILNWLDKMQIALTMRISLPMLLSSAWHAPTDEISRFPCNFFPKWPLNFLVSTIRQIIRPSPGALSLRYFQVRDMLQPTKFLELYPLLIWVCNVTMYRTHHLDSIFMYVLYKCAF